MTGHEFYNSAEVGREDALQEAEAAVRDLADNQWPSVAQLTANETTAESGVTWSVKGYEEEVASLDDGATHIVKQTMEI